MYCNMCGVQLPAGAAFCSRCGAQIASAAPMHPQQPALGSSFETENALQPPVANTESTPIHSAPFSDSAPTLAHTPYAELPAGYAQPIPPVYDTTGAYYAMPPIQQAAPHTYTPVAAASAQRQLSLTLVRGILFLLAGLGTLVYFFGCLYLFFVGDKNLFSHFDAWGGFALFSTAGAIREGFILQIIYLLGLTLALLSSLLLTISGIRALASRKGHRLVAISALLISLTLCCDFVSLALQAAWGYFAGGTLSSTWLLGIWAYGLEFGLLGLMVVWLVLSRKAQRRSQTILLPIENIPATGAASFVAPSAFKTTDKHSSAAKNS